MEEVMGKFRAARAAYPTAVLDIVVDAIEDDFERKQDDDGRWVTLGRKGRALGVQLAGVDPDGVPELVAVKVPAAFDNIEFGVGQHAVIVVELIEWVRDGRGGVTYRFAGFVTPDLLDSWKGVVNSQRQVAAAA